MNSFNYLKYIFLFLIFSIYICFSIDVLDDQITCLNNIAAKTGDPILNVANIKTTFCNSGSNQCHTNGSISKISITQNTTDSLSNSDINCFPNLLHFVGKKLSNISPGFFLNFNPSITNMDIFNTNLVQLDFPVSPLVQLLFGGVTLIKMTSLNNVKSFGSSDQLDIVVDVSGDTSNSVLWSFGCYVNNIPDFSVGLPLLTSLSWGIGTTFNESSMDNIISYDGKINSLSFNGNQQEISWPKKLSDFQNSKISFLYFSNGLNLKTSSYIDLGNFKSLSTFIILSAGPNFNIDGKFFPFKALPVATNNLQFFDGNVPNFPDLNIFKGVTYLMIQNFKITGPLPVNPLKDIYSINLNQNLINGTLDESWCNVFLTINKNLLTGPIPDCNYCYLNDSTVSVRFANNNFDNFSPATATCDHSKIVASFEKTSKNMFLHGKNLGTLPTNIKSTPACTFTYNYKTLNYSASCPDTDKVELNFVKPNINFTLSTGKFAPIITSMVQDNDTFSIAGSYLSYIGPEVKVSIGDTPIQCLVIDDPVNTSFYQAKCKIDYPIVEYGEKLASITVYNKTGTIKINLKYTPVPCPVSDCNGNGICNDHIGICECYEKWATVGSNICTVANHYVSSYIPLVEEQTDISMYGWFGLAYNNLSITIGQQNCGNNIFINETYFNCTLLPSSSPLLLSNVFTKQLLNMTQNQISWASFIYPYVNPILLCPNNCGNNATNGVCDTKTGNCLCNNGYSGLDCSPIPKNTDSTIPNSNIKVDSVGVIQISNEQNQFSISLDSISEVDFNGDTVAGKSKSLSNSWILKQTKDIQGITLFKQSFGTASLELSVQEVEQTKSFTFATNQFTIQSGGIKLSMSITNWTYSNSLNTLEIKISSSSTVDPKATVENKCNDNDLFNVESESNSKFISSLNYIKISKQAKVLYGRFQDKFLSDGRPTYLSTKLLSSDNDKVVIAINLPHCENECLLDPDFSVLVSPDFKSSDSCTSNGNGGNDKPSWLIPVAVVVPVIGVAIIVTAVILIVKKNSIAFKLGLNSISMKRR